MVICRLPINSLMRKPGLRSRLVLPTLRFWRYSSQKIEEEKLEEPVKFSQSRASRWTAKKTFGDPDPQQQQPPRIQGYVVNLSIVVFMVYFCMLREENDLDDSLSDLYKPIPGLSKGPSV